MPKNVLVADDSLTMRKVISLVLSTDDFRLVEVDNGMEAIARAQEMTPEVVLVDGSMPDKDGFEVCATLKKNPKTAHIPILLLLNGQEAIDEEKLRLSGADDHIAKPFESQALLDKVCNLVGLPLVAALPMRVPLSASKPQPVVSAASAVPVVPPAPVLPPAPVISAAVVPPIAPAAPPTSSVSPAVPAFVPPPSSPPPPSQQATTDLLPAFSKQPTRPATQAAAFASSSPIPNFAPPAPAPAPLREPIPRVAPVSGGMARRVPGAPVFGTPVAPSPSMGAGIAPSDPMLQATTLPLDSPSRPGFPVAPAFPPARAATAPPSAFAARPPPPPYASPSALRPLPLTQQLPPRPVTPLAAPMPRTALSQRVPVVSAPALFPPAGKPTAVPYPSQGYRPPLSARAPMPHQAVVGGMVRRDPFGLMGRTTPIPQAPPPAVHAEAALRELLPSISKELLEKVIWEVVPQLAETLIREHIERLIQAKEKGERR
ncbi:MAG: response regulator [Proteobacteria bacterium]|nr:response regulator [Cystobacterineae bacterium]MCL2258989.1 response regulator [Cystobacterineae bacterium]MCL2314440.1 response regulator [Pseudomonadota bacterium]